MFRVFTSIRKRVIGAQVLNMQTKKKIKSSVQSVNALHVFS